MPAPRHLSLPKSTTVLGWVLCLLLMLGGCASPTAMERGQRMDEQATAQGWDKLPLRSGRWVLTAYAPGVQHEAGETGVALTLYIEGDGFAWRTGTQPSDNPTPHNPVALALALQHHKGAVAYLARPCQNVQESDWGDCTEADWTRGRYAPAVLAAMDAAVTQLKNRAQAKDLVLVGYSGGGVMAALLAAGRKDVVRLVTVASNLDTAAWTRAHGLLPLSDSLNPADAWDALQDVPQLHFVGDEDAVVGIDVLHAYAQRFPAGKRPGLRLVQGADHNCCWAQLWPALSAEAFP